MDCAEPSRRLRSFACRLTSILALALVAPGVAAAGVTPMSADLETGDFSQFHQTNASVGTLNLVPGGYDDATSAAAVYSGGGQNGFSRGIFEPSWSEGDDVWYSAAYYLPPGFHASMQGQVALLRWDDWPSHPVDRASSGVVIWGRDKRARLVRELLPSGVSELSPSFELPEGRWFWLEVHQRLSSGAGAYNEVYLDGALIGQSSTPNTFAGRVAERMRYGIVAIADGAQTNPLSLNFDRATVSTQQVGPVPGLAQPPSTSTPTTTPPPTNTSTGTPTTNTGTSTDTSTTKKRSRKRRTARAARVTPSVRKCVRRALKRAADRGDARGLGKATERCVNRYGRVRAARRHRRR